MCYVYVVCVYVCCWLCTFLCRELQTYICICTHMLHISLSLYIYIYYTYVYICIIIHIYIYIYIYICPLPLVVGDGDVVRHGGVAEVEDSAPWEAALVKFVSTFMLLYVSHFRVFHSFCLYVYCLCFCCVCVIFSVLFLFVCLSSLPVSRGRRFGRGQIGTALMGPLQN